MAVSRCPTCRAHIEWVRTVVGRLPINYLPIPVDSDTGGKGWTLVRRQVVGRPSFFTLAPIAQCKPHELAKVKHVVTMHDECPQYRERIDQALGRLAVAS